MKRILITGANSYIGTSFEKYILQWPDDYCVETLDMLNPNWKKFDFSKFDIIFHVAGLAHQKETKKNADRYYIINRDLATEVATKAKNSKVKQFVFLSTMSVYGKDIGVIDKTTEPNPVSNYGISKFEAENILMGMQDENFVVSIVRPPMVYGKGCKGNFQTVIKLVDFFPIFPKVNNSRSMIYIDNLCEFIKVLIDTNRCGILIPQNSEYMNTTEMAMWISESLEKKVYASYLLGVIMHLLFPVFKKVRKAFGNLTYEKGMTTSCDVMELSESVKQSV